MSERPAPEDLGKFRHSAGNELDNLYYIGLRWMDRARKAEHLNAVLLTVLKAVKSGHASEAMIDDAIAKADSPEAD